MPLPAILQALGLFSSDGNNSMLEDSPNSRNMYLNMLQQERETQDSIVAEYIPFHNPAAQQASHSGSQLLAVEGRLVRAEADIFTLKETCHKLELLLEQYELINRELADRVLDLCKTP